MSLSHARTYYRIPACLMDLSDLEGLLGMVLIDLKSRKILSQITKEADMDIDAAFFTDVMANRLKMISRPDSASGIEDIILTESRKQHVLRCLGGPSGKLLYLCLDRNRANLVLARLKMSRVEARLLPASGQDSKEE